MRKLSKTNEQFVFWIESLLFLVEWSIGSWTRSNRSRRSLKRSKIDGRNSIFGIKREKTVKNIRKLSFLSIESLVLYVCVRKIDSIKANFFQKIDEIDSITVDLFKKITRTIRTPSIFLKKERKIEDWKIKFPTLLKGWRCLSLIC